MFESVVLALPYSWEALVIYSQLVVHYYVVSRQLFDKKKPGAGDLEFSSSVVNTVRR